MKNKKPDKAQPVFNAHGLSEMIKTAAQAQTTPPKIAKICDTKHNRLVSIEVAEMPELVRIGNRVFERQWAVLDNDGATLFIEIAEKKIMHLDRMPKK